MLIVDILPRRSFYDKTLNKLARKLGLGQKLVSYAIPHWRICGRPSASWLSTSVSASCVEHEYDDPLIRGRIPLILRSSSLASLYSKLVLAPRLLWLRFWNLFDCGIMRLREPGRLRSLGPLPWFLRFAVLVLFGIFSSFEGRRLR